MNYKRIDPPRKVQDWPGLHVISKRDMANGYIKIPAGTIFEVGTCTINKHLTGLPCACCGVCPKIVIKANRAEFLQAVDFVSLETPGKPAIMRVNSHQLPLIEKEQEHGKPHQEL